MRTAIIIPARYGSTRLPGKPLLPIAGIPMLERMVTLARQATITHQADIYVATDDSRIAAFCDTLGVEAIITDKTCISGTDRVAQAVASLPYSPDFIVNLQGDAPLTPPEFITAMIEAFSTTVSDVVTPVCQLDWAALDALRLAKQTTPFSGTCAVFNRESKRGYWFSKNIIPSIRKEAALRQSDRLSPVFQHIGLYGYSPEALQAFAELPESRYEQLEGLEQLRLLEAGLHIQCVEVSPAHHGLGGVDSQEDIARVEAILNNNL